MLAPPYPLQPQPMRRGWLERHPNWKIPIGALALLLLIAGFVSALMLIVFGSFRASDVYQQAVARAGQSAQVREGIGAPLRTGWVVSGRLQVNGRSGSADFTAPISGPEGAASIRVIASKNHGIWRFSCLQVKVEGQADSIDLLAAQSPPGQ